MFFGFSEEQRAFQATLRGLLARECPAARVRAAWQAGPGRSRDLWKALADVGLLGVTVPEGAGGVGGDELDLVLLLEECGRAALPEPVLETTAVAVPLLRDAGTPGAARLAAELLPRVAAGEVVLTVGVAPAPYVTDAHVADVLLLASTEALVALRRADVELVAQPSVDGARRLFGVRPAPGAGTRLAEGEVARRLAADAFDRGALAAAAELLGLAAQMIDVTVAYASVRAQFGAAIGSFQAVKHHLANAHLALEIARPVVYRAAYGMARRDAERKVHVSMAKAYASEAARLASRVALQCHGAIGYSFEHDLHLWMKRAWALGAAWGDAAFHRARVADAVLGAAPPARGAPAGIETTTTTRGEA